MTIPSTLFCSIPDVAERGADAFCDELSALGVTGATVAITYHAARDLRPRGVESALTDSQPGTLYLPSPELAGIQPGVPPEFADRDVLAELRTATTARGQRLAAWTVYGFDERLARLRPDLAQRTALDDVRTSDLCPANPEVQAYWHALTEQIASRRPDAIVAEALHYAPLRLLRRFMPLDAWAKLAMDLCFCEHCLRAATRAGVPGAAVRDWAAELIHSAFRGERSESDRTLSSDDLASVLDGALTAYLGVRCDTVLHLADRLAAVARDHGVDFDYLDQAAAGSPVLGPTAVDDARRDGVDVTAISAVADDYIALGYAADLDRFDAIIRPYADAIGAGGARLRVALRPAWPDCTSTEQFTEKLRRAQAAGAVAADFYHYGFVSDDALVRVHDALAEVSR